MKEEAKWVWIPVLAFMLGLGAPPYLAGISSAGFDTGIAFMLPAALTAYQLLKWAGRKHPAVRQFMLNTLAGVTLLFFVAALICSGLSTGLAVLELPRWANITLGIIWLLSVGLMILMSRSEETE